jgi:uncharacterized protein YjiS (DUF1127 family)
LKHKGFGFGHTIRVPSSVVWNGCASSRRLIVCQSKVIPMAQSIHSVTHSIGSTFFGRAALLIVASVAGLAKALKHRAEIRQLADFDDRMLKDIGLTRSEVTGALEESIFENPSVLLVRSFERRHRFQRGDEAQKPVRPIVPTVKRGVRLA